MSNLSADVLIIEDDIYKTTPITVEVTSAVETPTDGNNSDFVASENLHLVAEISDSNPFLNEAITVVYKLYVSPLVSVSNWREMDSPVYSDFWSQNIDIRQLKIESGEYQGQPYRYVILRKTILYPQKTGELEIQPLALSVSVDVPSQRRDIFGGRLYTTVDKTVTAGRKTITVKPLPLANRPANFTGAVGDYDFKLSASKTKLAATESLTLKVIVSGKGNLKLFDLPKVQVPSSLELYEPERMENVRTDLNGTQGSIADTYTIVPNLKGNFPIPALSFSYFDLDSKSYRTINTEEIMLNVEGAPANSSYSAGSGVNKLPVEATGKQFNYIKLSTKLKPINSGPFLGSALFWTLLSLPIIVVLLGLVLGKKRQEMTNDLQGIKIKKANRLAKKYLSEAKKNLGDQKSFYIALERALHNYLKAKLNIQTNEMSKDKIVGLLQERNADPETSKEFMSLIESCEFARYASSTGVNMNQDYEKAAATISSLDKQL